MKTSSPFFGAPVAAGDGSIEEADVALGAGAGDPASECGRNSAGVNIGAAGLEARKGAGIRGVRAPEDAFEGWRIADDGDEDVRGGAHFPGGLRELRAHGYEFVGARSGAIPDGEREAGLEKIHTHGLAHEAESDESNFCFGGCRGFHGKLLSGCE